MDLALRYTADVTGGTPIAVWSQSLSGSCYYVLYKWHSVIERFEIRNSFHIPISSFRGKKLDCTNILRLLCALTLLLPSVGGDCCLFYLAHNIWHLFGVYGSRARISRSIDNDIGHGLINRHYFTYQCIPRQVKWKSNVSHSQCR
jgi:hypothetical protein